jgi:KUP system potassium uptake protein
VLGVLSLIFWSLILVVTVKYVVLILRADNRGEGGVLALGTLAARSISQSPGVQLLVLVLSLVGLALFYGDGLITPAISVLSALEGLQVATPAFEPYILPLAFVVLLALFMIQSRGTGSVGKVFGPVVLLWFAALLSSAWLRSCRCRAYSARSIRSTARPCSGTSAGRPS